MYIAFIHMTIMQVNQIWKNNTSQEVEVFFFRLNVIALTQIEEELDRFPIGF